MSTGTNLSQIVQNDPHKVTLLDIDHPATNEPSGTAITPANAESTIQQAGSSFLSLDSAAATPARAQLLRQETTEWSSPAFLKHARLSYGSFAESSSNLFENDDGTIPGKGRKRARFGRDSGRWRYSSRSPSPELPVMNGNTTTDQELDSAEKPEMTDEGCQTMDFDEEHVIRDRSRSPMVQGQVYMATLDADDAQHPESRAGIPADLEQLDSPSEANVQDSPDREALAEDQLPSIPARESSPASSGARPDPNDGEHSPKAFAQNGPPDITAVYDHSQSADGFNDEPEAVAPVADTSAMEDIYGLSPTTRQNVEEALHVDVPPPTEELAIPAIATQEQQVAEHERGYEESFAMPSHQNETPSQQYVTVGYPELDSATTGQTQGYVEPYYSGNNSGHVSAPDLQPNQNLSVPGSTLMSRSASTQSGVVDLTEDSDEEDNAEPQDDRLVYDDDAVEDEFEDDYDSPEYEEADDMHSPQGFERDYTPEKNDLEDMEDDDDDERLEVLERPETLDARALEDDDRSDIINDRSDNDVEEVPEVYEDDDQERSQGGVSEEGLFVEEYVEEYDEEQEEDYGNEYSDDYGDEEEDYDEDDMSEEEGDLAATVPGPPKEPVVIDLLSSDEEDEADGKDTAAAAQPANQDMDEESMVDDEEEERGSDLDAEGEPEDMMGVHPEVQIQGGSEVEVEIESESAASDSDVEDEEVIALDSDEEQLDPAEGVEVAGTESLSTDVHDNPEASEHNVQPANSDLEDAEMEDVTPQPDEAQLVTITSSPERMASTSGPAHADDAGLGHAPAEIREDAEASELDESSNDEASSGAEVEGVDESSDPVQDEAETPLDELPSVQVEVVKETTVEVQVIEENITSEQDGASPVAVVVETAHVEQTVSSKPARSMMGLDGANDDLMMDTVEDMAMDVDASLRANASVSYPALPLNESVAERDSTEPPLVAEDAPNDPPPDGDVDVNVDVDASTEIPYPVLQFDDRAAATDASDSQLEQAGTMFHESVNEDDSLPVAVATSAGVGEITITETVRQTESIVEHGEGVDDNTITVTQVSSEVTVTTEDNTVSKSFKSSTTVVELEIPETQALAQLPTPGATQVQEMQPPILETPAVAEADASTVPDGKVHRNATKAPRTESINGTLPKEVVLSTMLQAEESPEPEDASAQLALSVLSSPSKPSGHGAPSSHAQSQTDLRVKLSRPLQTDLAVFTPLKLIRFNIEKKIDVLVVVTSLAGEPQRAKNGARHYHLKFQVTDASVAASNVTAVHIFRPFQSALPVVETGDVVLLRGFVVKSEKGANFALRSGEESAWVVFKPGDGDEVGQEQVRGPPVEFGEGERRFVADLRSWYGGLDEKIRMKLEKVHGKAKM